MHINHMQIPKRHTSTWLLSYICFQIPTWSTQQNAYLTYNNNIHINDAVSRDEFIAMREGRDAQLGMPKLILPSIQVNVRAGELPAPEDNDIRYLKIPLDAV